MISPVYLELFAAATYAAAFVVLLGRVRVIPPDLRRYCYPLLGVIGLASVATALDLAAVGSITIAGNTLSLPTIAEGVVAYAVVWGTCAWLAGVDRRLLAPIVGIPIVQVVIFHVAVAISPTAARYGAIFVIVGYVVVTYLMVGPVWSAARERPRARRLLHWKCRNLLVFLTGVLILFATIAVTVTLTDFVVTVLTLYIEMIIRIGIAGFLFANVSALGEAADAGGDAVEGRTPTLDSTVG